MASPRVSIYQDIPGWPPKWNAQNARAEACERATAPKRILASIQSAPRPSPTRKPRYWVSQGDAVPLCLVYLGQCDPLRLFGRTMLKGEQAPPVQSTIEPSGVAWTIPAHCHRFYRLRVAESWSTADLLVDMDPRCGSQRSSAVRDVMLAGPPSGTCTLEASRKQAGGRGSMASSCK